MFAILASGFLLSPVASILFVKKVFGPPKPLPFATDCQRGVRPDEPFLPLRGHALTAGVLTYRLRHSTRIAEGSPILISDIRYVTLDELRRDLRVGTNGRAPSTALLFVHGYNNSFRGVAADVARFQRDLRRTSPTLFFAWPSLDTTTGYVSDYSSVDWSAPHLADLLRVLASETDQIDIVTHSMGARLASDALEQYARSSTQNRRCIRHLIFAAPDVDVDVFAQKLPAIRKVVDRVTIYATSSDVALAISTFLGHYPRLGYNIHAASIIAGVDVIDVSHVESGFLSKHHSYYRTNRRVLQDEWALLEHGDGPEKRFGLSAIRDAYGSHWVMLP
jgi:pimeloyl-ACP methyl ester carboxylesterase